jgi:hypothetical protein
MLMWVSLGSSKRRGGEVRGGGQPIAELGERGEQEGVNTVEGKKTEGGKGGGWEHSGGYLARVGLIDRRKIGWGGEGEGLI